MTQALSVLVIGLGIGWLSGLSVSPVIAALLASLVGAAGGVVAGIRSMSRAAPADTVGDGQARPDARPLALLVAGIALAAPVGIMARTYGVLQPSATGRTETESGTSLRAGQGVLFGVSVQQCQELSALSDFRNEQAYRDVVAGSGEWGRLLAADVDDIAKLKAIVGAICAKQAH